MTSTDVKFFFTSSTGVSEIKKYTKALRQTTDEKQKRFLFIWVCFYLLYLAKAGGGEGGVVKNNFRLHNFCQGRQKTIHGGKIKYTRW